ncbi:unnamed protein product [Mesocestoides corti]|uniref:Rho-GAP domain-containing protein n=1 Tax=Mesocestoides corti TaxID=53468 RepID=A0A0R3UA73_MESCO|nr:unnamed protein product [Mesocestoides corti]
MVDCVETYRASAEGRDLHDIELTYANRLPTVLEANAAAAAATSTEHRLVKLAQIIKRFLRELPEPVIPTDFYESTVSLAGQTDPSKSNLLSSVSS